MDNPRNRTSAGLAFGKRVSSVGLADLRDAEATEMLGHPYPLLTGQQIFESKTKGEQDEMLGPEAAERVRSGETQLADLVEESHLETSDDFITQAPIGAQ